TQYQPSIIVAEPAHQHLAAGFPIGKRFKSAPVIRVADANPVHLGHHHRADGRWRIYAFAADPTHRNSSSVLDGWADWLVNSPESPVVAYTPKDADIDSVFDVKVIYQQDHTRVDLTTVPTTFLPRVGPLHLIDYEKVYAAQPGADVFAAREIDRRGAVVVVRPDQYVAHVLPLTGTKGLADFFAGVFIPQRNAHLTKDNA
ncbi:MAG: phenol 2-monooxygenase, partial [Mycobacterium sp.]|nr:phenol 2-monooxygenase [Mycobacterium sp.]